MYNICTVHIYITCLPCVYIYIFLFILDSFSKLSSLPLGPEALQETALLAIICASPS